MDIPLPDEFPSTTVDYWINTRSGEMLAAYSDSGPPENGPWLQCAGQQIEKALEPRLCRFLGGQYGEDDIYFNLPDMRGVTA